MQIEAIKVTDYLQSTKETNLMPETVIKNNSKADSKSEESLRSISIDNSIYNKKGQQEEKTVDKLKKAEGMDLTGKEELMNTTSLWGEDIVRDQEEDGFDPMDADAHTIVTVTDKILMKMAAVGVDISKYGGLSDKKLSAMSDSIGQAIAMKNELKDNLTDENIRYLISNELEPTLENVYDATYKAPAQPEGQMNEEEAQKVVEQMAPQIEKLAEGLDGEFTADEVKEYSTKLLAMDLPVTKENIAYINDLENYEKPDESQLMGAIDDIILEGKEPKEAYVIQGYSIMDKAREIKTAIDNYEKAYTLDLYDVEKKIQLEEVRMLMTVEANFSLIKGGNKLDVNDLQQIIDQLKAQQKEIISQMFGEENLEKLENNVELYNTTKQYVAEIGGFPEELLGRFSQIQKANLTEIHAEGRILKEVFENAQRTYEAVGTAPRADMGDSIKKAFNNIDDILSDMEIAVDADNQRAARILAYNQMDITEENIAKVKESGQMLQRVFKNMSPAVVVEMIKRGENPLDLKLEDLIKETEAIKGQTGSSSDSEGFARFLYKAEQNGQISDEQRQAYIGIYRLIHQVEAADGAPVGALIQQGSEVTFRNLMTAVRSEKHKGREYKIDDSFGGLKELNIKDLSITQQIEMAFNIERLRDAKEAMTPAKMTIFENEAQMMDLTPDQFAYAMEKQEAKVEEQQYIEFMSQQMNKAVESEEKVYRILEEMDIPVTARNLQAMEMLLTERNKAFKDLFKNQAEDEDMDIEDVILMTMERFGEACKTPEDMADAEEELAELAENVMKNMLVEKDVQSIDVRGMKLVMTQISTFGTMARENETFNIPIMVADQAGNLTLKVVRGSGEKGLLQLALSLQNTGTVTGSFRYEAGQLMGEIDCDNEGERARIAESIPTIALSIQRETNLGVSVKVKYETNLDANEIYESSPEAEEATDQAAEEVKTSVLYGAARALIGTLGDIL